MAKVISQETFDEVVKDNIVEFAMNIVDAKDETIKQFEAQGINLANIIKDLSLNEKTGQPVLNETIELLKVYVSGTTPLSGTEIINNLNNLEIECKKSVPHRVLAAKNGGYETICQIIQKHFNDTDEAITQEILKKCLLAANAIISKQPDIFDAKTLGILIQILNTHTDPVILGDVLRWLSKACIMHEINRQNIMNADILQYLVPLLKRQEVSIIKDLCSVFRYLILDDDIRVEFSKAHEHARIIATQVLPTLTALLSKFKDDTTLLPDLVLTIASLAVRNEFCTLIEDSGGLNFIIDALSQEVDVKLAKESFKLLRALAGNDAVKEHIIQKGAAPLIKQILEIHMSEELIAKDALACIATLTLRSAENSKTFYDCGIAELILDIMKQHSNSKSVMRNGSWAIRNMISRSRYQCDSFKSYDAEDVLNTAMKEHPTIMQDIKSALRDLGCKITLNEEWTNATALQIAKDL